MAGDQLFMAESSKSSVAAMEMVEEGQIQVKIAPEVIKFQEIVENVEEDRISALPEHLLLDILSRLPYTKEAIKTGALSKRWEHLWKSVPGLFFRNIGHKHPLSDFVSSVDKTLTQCRHLKLKELGLITIYDTQFELQFNNWIRYAISSNVEKLILTLWKGKFVLDQIFFTGSCFTYMRLSGCVFNPIGPVCWKNLRHLCIIRMKLDEDLVENILSGSPVLETFKLDDCYGYKVLNITSKSVKNLVFTGYVDYKCKGDDIIKINAPNILSLTIESVLELKKLLLLNVSSLVEANLNYEVVNYLKRTPIEEKEEMIKGFIQNLSHVKELNIGFFSSKIVSRLVAQGFTIPSNMKLPDVTCDWSDSCSIESEDEIEIEDE